MDFIAKFPIAGEWYGNAERRDFLNSPEYWKNTLYDPMTNAEEQFRDKYNIYLKPKYRKQ